MVEDDPSHASKAPLIQLVRIIFAMNGFAAMLGGAVLPVVIADFGLSPLLAGLFIGLPAIGIILAGIIGGVLAHRLGTKFLLTLGTAGLALSAVLTGIASNSAFLLLGAGCFGIANGLIEVSGSAIIVASSGDRSAPELNRLNLYFGIGALASPACVAVLLSHGLAWRNSYYLAIIPSAALAIESMRRPSHSIVKHRSSMGVFALARQHPMLILSWLGMVLLLSAEQATTGWISAYLIRVDLLPAGTASLALSVYWLAILAGRLANTRIPVSISYRRIIAFEVAGSILFLWLTLAATNTVIGILSLGLAGLFMAGLYPTLMAYVTQTKLASPAAVLGFLVAAVGIGKLGGPTIIGFVAGEVGLPAAMNLIPLMLLGLVFAVIVIDQRFTV